ncbi:NitT/TauT family transport system ATP-binding protein [Paenibacillus forsythiae]|uniref:NitT/TauT family transport system ATP-binding protein n=1 Tax=Paenibacillus forsythiae TaxID=365616 RepID=A0ABU3H8R2_9BACL|nr:ABC transporter ATP-binding protein [Paenibacillus forsythiae]MDT3426407.1 NitT/TauT family transport system ATP-binding protein [Paenibacillus forsythiae]
MAATEAKIKVSGVTRRYSIRQNKDEEKKLFTALQDVDLEVRPGEFLTIVGPSGCGKSTLLDLIAGLATPTQGELYIDGKKINGPALDRGIVMQGYALFPWRTVRRNVEFGLEIKKVPKKDRKDISDRFLELVGLANYADRYPYELSGGMKQRVAIARALAYDPEVLLMDEPFAAVDAQTRETLQDELLRIWEQTGKTIIFVTHSIDEAVALADRVVVMSPNPGKVREIVPVSLPRPRRVGDVQSTADFSWIRHRVWELLQGETASPKPPVQQTPVQAPLELAEQLSSSAAL